MFFFFPFLDIYFQRFQIFLDNPDIFSRIYIENIFC